MKAKKILIVTESIDVEDSSGSKANLALIRNLHKAGFVLKVLHYTRKPIKLEGISCVSIVEEKWNKLFLLSRLQRKIQKYLKVDLSRRFENNFGFSFTFFNDTKSIASTIQAETDFAPDLIITLSKGASFRPHYALLQLPEFHSKWMAYVHDPFPFHFYPKPYDWVMPGAKQKELFFKKVAKKAKYAAFPSKILQEWMGQFFPEFLETGVIIPHQMQEEEIIAIGSPPYLDLERFNILHAGALLKQRPPDYLILGFEKFLQKNPEAAKHSKLLLVGSNSYHAKNLQEFSIKIPQLYVSNGYVPYSEVRWLQENVDVNVILEAKAEISPFLPGKFPHCVGANKPILHLGPKNSEVKRLLGTEYPYHSEVDDVDKISDIIEEFYLKWRNNDSLQLNREDLQYYLSYQNLGEKLMDFLLKDIIKGNYENGKKSNHSNYYQK